MKPRNAFNRIFASALFLLLLLVPVRALAALYLSAAPLISAMSTPVPGKWKLTVNLSSTEPINDVYTFLTQVTGTGAWAPVQDDFPAGDLNLHAYNFGDLSEGMTYQISVARKVSATQYETIANLCTFKVAGAGPISCPTSSPSSGQGSSGTAAPQTGGQTGTGNPSGSGTQTPAASTATQPSGNSTPVSSGGGVSGVVTYDTAKAGDGTCGDGSDNDHDGKVDWDGVRDAAGQPKYPPDPSCLTKDMTETGDIATGSQTPLIPCVNKCDLPAFFTLLNNAISFFFTVFLAPISICIFVYAGYKYITAQGNSAKRANIKKMVGNLIKGIILILAAWLLVNTALRVVGYNESLLFFQEG